MSTKDLCALLERVDLGLDALLALVGGELLLAVLLALGDPLGLVGLVGELGLRVLADGVVSVLVHLLEVLRADVVGKVGSELLLEALVIFFLEVLHVLGDL